MKYFLLLFSLIIIFACSDSKNLAGASTVETENASVPDSSFTIRIIQKDSSPVANAVAFLRPSWYLQNIDSSIIDENSIQKLIADSLGIITLDSIAFNKMFIEINNDGAGVFKPILKSEIENNKTITLTLEKTGSITGNVKIPKGTRSAWVQIYGTDKLVKTDSLGNFSIDSLPPSEYTIRAIVSENEPALGEGNVNVKSQNNTHIKNLESLKNNEDLSQWNYSRTDPISYFISDWMKPLNDTTIVFLRLNSSNFNFDEVMKGGLDIRFSDQNGNILEHKITAWDDTLFNGTIQIRINNSSDIDSIITYWGKSAAANKNSKNIWMGISDSLYKALNSLVIIDFEKNSLEVPFEYKDGTTRDWYYKTQDSTVKVTPTIKNTQEAFEYDNERNGIVFHWSATVEKYGKWSMIGIRLCNKPCNFMSVDSISFFAKGNGELGFVFEALNEPTGKTKYVDYLNSDWKEFVFTPEQFVEGDGEFGNMGWDFVKPRVTTVTFWIVDNSEVWVDDIRIYGINRDDLN